MFIRKSILTVAAILITAVSVWGQFATTTTTTTTSTSTLPPIGIGTTETAQVILTNNATSALTEGTAPSCTGSVSFYNASGSIIGSATSFTLGAGQINSVNLPYASTAVSTPRALVRAVVSQTTTLPNPAPCSLSYSLATFDTTSGVTHTVIVENPITAVVAPIVGKL
jgi:hypothetical protein